MQAASQSHLPFTRYKRKCTLIVSACFQDKRDCLSDGGFSAFSVYSEEDGTRHVINNFIWEMSIRTISTKVEDVSHKNL